jgi:hypothetical protein
MLRRNRHWQLWPFRPRDLVHYEFAKVPSRLIYAPHSQCRQRVEVVKAIKVYVSYTP